MNDICLPTRVKTLSSDVKALTSREQAVDLLKSLYGFLDFTNENWMFLPAEHRILLAHFTNRGIGSCEYYIQQTLVEMIRKLDTQSKAKAAFRKASRPEGDELSVDPYKIMEMLQSIQIHFVGHTKLLSDKQVEIGLQNLYTLLNQCYREPYLRCFAPLYIFLRYKYAGADFFESVIPSDDIYIYSYLKHNKDLYNQKYERKDIMLMASLLNATASCYPLLQQTADHGMDDFAIELNRIISIEDPDTQIPLSSYLSIPNWGNILDLLLAQEKIKREDIPKYLAPLLGENPRTQTSDDEIGKLLRMMQRIAYPQNYWSEDMDIPMSTPYKTALRTACQILCPENYCEKMMPTQMLRLLEKQNLFSSINLSLYAFFRITRYRPDALIWDEHIKQISQTLDFLLRRHTEIVNDLFDFPLLPPEPSSKSVFNQTHQVCHAIYEKWYWDYTVEFCKYVLLGAEDHTNELVSFFSKLEGSYDKQNIDGIHNILDLNMKINFVNPEFLLTVFVDGVLQGKKEKPLKVFRSLVLDNPVGDTYVLYTVLHQCLSLVSWDLRRRFWTFQYDLMDYLYPLRCAK